MTGSLWARPTCPQCPQDPVPCVPSAARAGLRDPNVALSPSTPGPQLAHYLALEELLRPQELVGEDPVSRGAAAWGLVALWPWQKGERRTVTGVLEQPPWLGRELSPRPHGVVTSLTCRGGQLPIAWLRSQKVLLEVVAGGGQRLGERRSEGTRGPRSPCWAAGHSFTQ